MIGQNTYKLTATREQVTVVVYLMLARQVTRRPLFVGLRMSSSSAEGAIKVEANTLTPSDKTQEISNESVSGAPRALSRDRIVRIFKQSKPATQSGTWGKYFWEHVTVVSADSRSP
jgi:hypothetical protein